MVFISTASARLLLEVELHRNISPPRAGSMAHMAWADALRFPDSFGKGNKNTGCFGCPTIVRSIVIDHHRSLMGNHRHFWLTELSHVHGLRCSFHRFKLSVAIHFTKASVVFLAFLLLWEDLPSSLTTTF